MAARIRLPEEHEDAGGETDLAAPNAVLLDASLHGRLRLGCLSFEALALGDASPEVAAELNAAAEGLRGMWSHVTDLAEIPGVSAGRELFDELKIDQQRFQPRAEALLDKVLRGRQLKISNPLEASIALSILRMRMPMAAYDAASIGHPILVRTGAADEAYAGTGRGRIVLAGKPALCDPEGPFGSPIGDARRTKLKPGTERALVVLYAPTSADPAGLETALDAVAKTVIAHCGGAETGRLVVG